MAKSPAVSVSILSGFTSAVVSEAVTANAHKLASAGRVSDVAAELFESVGLSFVVKGGKGASPKGAHFALSQLVVGDAPSRALIKGIAKSWADVCQSLHTLVSILHAANACDAAPALPAWADPDAVAKAKAAANAKRAATKAQKAANAAESADEGDGLNTDNSVQQAPSAPTANLIAAAIKAGQYSAADIAIIVQALQAVHAIAEEEATA